ncbi:hypothetical protein AGMMS50262_17050 [Bacteroidia bacterium]|nr:hypothetical protein AGMMS50262_17050 [Bacteroidia bacterium]
MKRVFFYLIFLFCISPLFAQGHASRDLIFPQYEEGTALLKDGTKAKGFYNYSMTKSQIQYLDDNGIVMTFANPQEVSVVTISDRVFENTPKGFLERVPVGDGFYYIDWHIKLVSVGKKTAYGSLSQSASANNYVVSADQPEVPTTNVSPMYWSYSPNTHNSSPQAVVNGIMVQYDDGVKAFADCSYFLKINGQFKKFDSAKSLSKILGCCQEELQAFVKKENVNFKNPQDVYRMMTTFLANSEKTASVYDFTVKTIDGADFPLSKLKGKKVMIVNVASKCGLTPQYKQLQELYNKYKDKNFVIIGFPANNFGAQEPGSNAEIKEFCTANYGVTFPMMAKISVKGDDMSPLYQWLTEQSKNGVANAEVAWNFQKFLIDERGHWVKSIAPGDSPQSEEIIAWIEKK